MTTRVAVQDELYPTPAQIRDAILRAIAYEYAKSGLVANVLPGSDHFVRAEKLANRVSIAIANGQLARRNFSPLTATGAELVALAAVFGVFPRLASSAAGALIIRCVGTVIIPSLFQCISSAGQLYQTIALATRTTLQTVDVIAVGTGTQTNLAADAKVQWTSGAIATLNPIATVDSAGLTGGKNSDDDEALRARLLFKLAFPPVGGNWAQVVEWGTEASAAVEATYVYPAARGPAAYDVACTKAGGDRTLPLATLNIIRAYIASKMPGQNDLGLTSVTAQLIDVTIVASLPLPLISGGQGGGWTDPTPWPAEDTKVTVFGADTATVDAVVSPQVGNSIAIWDPDAVDGDGNPAPTMRTYIIATVGGVTTAWFFTVQSGFGSFDPTGCYVSAGAAHLGEYASDIAAKIATLGPGEKTDSTDVLPRGRRRPTTDVSGPYTLTTALLSSVVVAHAEIADLTFGIHYKTGTTTNIVEPDLPLAVGDPPNILVLRNLAIRATS